MKKFVIIAALVFLAGQTISAQDAKFRKVSKEELEATAHSHDAEAAAAILHQSCRRYYVYSDNDGWFNLYTYVHQRIKIYKKEGMSWADFSIPYHTKGNFSKFKAYTYNYSDGKIVEERLDNDAVFTEESSKYLKRRNFAMPAVLPGSVIDIEYELVEPSNIALRPFYFQYDIPVDFCQYEVQVPEYFNMNKTINGLPLAIDVKRDQKQGTISSINSKVGTMAGRETSTKTTTTRYSINIDIYEAINIPALKDEPFVPSMNNYRAAIFYELSFIQLKGGEIFNYSSSWNEIADKLMTGENFGTQINMRLNDLNDVVEQFAALPPEECMYGIYLYVRNNYSWNGNYGEQTELGLRKLLSEKSGNIGDVNLLLINLLKKAKLDVSPVVLSSRENGFLNIQHPTYAQLDYVIAAVNLNDQRIFLDATDDDLLPGYLPTRALNLDGILIINAETASRIEITNPNVGSTIMFLLTELKDDLSIEGQARITYTNYDAVVFRSKYKSYERDGGYQNKLHDHYPDLKIVSHKLEGFDQPSNKVTEFVEMTLDGHAEQMGELIFLSPMMIWQNTENQFKLEEREFPVFYNSTRSDKYTISIKLPAGYAVETLPEQVRLLLPEDLGSFHYAITDNNGTLMLQYQYDIKDDIISPAHYPSLRYFTIMMIEKQAEKVVLKKI